MLNAGGAPRPEVDPRTQQDESRMKMKIVDVNRVRTLAYDPQNSPFVDRG